METITIRRPDDFHIHLRQGQMLKDVLPFTVDVFKRAVVMGNTVPPIKFAADVLAYYEEIKSCATTDFEPIMSVVLINGTTPEIVRAACAAGAKVLKLIPSGTSTNSQEGVPLDSVRSYYPVLERAVELGMIFSVHFELVKDPETGEEIHELEREERSIPYLLQLTEDFPSLKIVVEHVSSQAMVNVVRSLPANVGATITAHHLMLTYQDVYFAGKVMDAHNYCKPVAKSEFDRSAVIEAAVSGNPKFFFGSDSAPHHISKKMLSFGDNSHQPAAGVFSAPVALPVLCQIFQDQGALNRLEDFVSKFGAEFYNLPLNEGTITLCKKPWKVPHGKNEIAWFRGYETLDWQVKS